jgi:hypothetical protein
MKNKELELRKRNRVLLKALEEELESKKEFVKEEQEIMYKKEKDFFSKQVGKYFKTKSGKRFLKILDYGITSHNNHNIFDVKYYDLGDKIEKSYFTSVYSVFGFDFEFETQEITEEEYLKNLKGVKAEV